MEKLVGELMRANMRHQDPSEITNKDIISHFMLRLVYYRRDVIRIPINNVLGGLNCKWIALTFYQFYLYVVLKTNRASNLQGLLQSAQILWHLKMLHLIAASLGKCFFAYCVFRERDGDAEGCDHGPRPLAKMFLLMARTARSILFLLTGSSGGQIFQFCCTLRRHRQNQKDKFTSFKMESNYMMSWWSEQAHPRQVHPNNYEGLS